MADKEYIERELATKILEEHMTKTAQAGNKLMKSVYLMAKGHAIDYLNIMPTADVVEVVRCKDCIYRQNKLEICDKFRRRYPFFPEDDFYCGFGAKMDGKGEGE